ncbi:hypothetical protein SAMN05920897_1373 [Alkalispirochaeta americana]|uniref:Alpha/beta hydrolase family protein n=2 Tax=Alkalispirochaeta americana TaxID=159291 RepID=A0A1N6Y2J8_9SPIO|nr:hypothetical protein SAMN05920897_1373 [Alkalispirochaeta americana]
MRYGDNSEFNSANDQLKDEWIEYDSNKVCEFLNTVSPQNNKRIFIAKSLGTKHLYYQLKNNFINKEDVLIFQTPIIPFVVLQDLLIEKGNNSLIIYGTKDPVLDDKEFNRINSTNKTQVYEVPNAGHVFEDENELAKSIDNIKNVMLETEKFLSKVM